MFTTRPEITGTFGAVASTHYLASSSGMAVLEAGGNAYDAAAAAAFVLHVVEPHLNGPGGDVPIMFAPAGQRPRVLCGQGPAPAGATIEHYRGEGLDLVPGSGALAAAVPGAVDAWLLLLRDHGTWELGDVLSYAIGYARDGHPIVRQAAGMLEFAARPPVVRTTAAVAEAFVTSLDGTPFEAPVAAGAEVSKRIDRWAKPLTGTTRTRLVVQLDPPDSGNAWFLSVLGLGAEGTLLPIEQALADGKSTKPLADELNALIAHNQDVVERQRTHVGNLAHALKTPLSVMLTEARQQPGALADVVEHQAELMRGQVDHHLRRARAAARAQSVGERTLVEPVLDELAVTLEKIFQDKNLVIDWRCPEDLCFRGEKQDFLEIAGNVMENAGKWGKGKVRVTAQAEGPGRLRLMVEDDGPGLPPDRRGEVLKRGARLDESAPGSGLGLAIVDELARAYGGGLELAESSLGGLKVVLSLPSAEN